MIRQLRISLLVSALLAATALGAAAEDGESVSFTFAPTDGERWVRSGEYVSIQDPGSGAAIRESQTLHEVTQTYHQTEGGWEVEQVARKAQMLVDGVEQANEAMQLTVGMPITLEMDESGEAVSVRGFRDFMRRLEDELPLVEFQAIQAKMSQEAFEASEIRGWNSKLEFVRGETVQPGDAWGVRKLHRFGRSAIPVEGVLRFDGWAELDGTRAFKILFDADNQGIATRRYDGELARQLNLVDGEYDDARSNLSVIVSEVLMVVPETGQVLYASEEAKVTLQSSEFAEIPNTQGYFENRNVERWKRES